MTNAQDRQHAVELVNTARRDGARLAKACAEMRIGLNTYRRWSAGGEDARAHAVHATPSHALSQAERAVVLQTCLRPDFASLPPSQIVVRLLDEEARYLASESTFYRVLREANAQHRRGRAAAPRHVGPPRRHRADGPNQLWSWDVTYLAKCVRGQFYYLYLILDIYSRKIVGAEVFEAENMVNSGTVVQRAVLREQCLHQPLVLHADNGSAMKGSTLQITLEKLGITPSHSRPRVSNDNAFSEALFRTCKYRPDFPPEGFESLQDARLWVHQFANWYNHEHRHSAIRFVAPAHRHAGQDKAILEKRRQLYQVARQNNPARWSGKLRNWEPIGCVWLNPKPDDETRQLRDVLEAA
ncbi:Mobile element protein [Caballeronia sordidicola]|uniref:Mobile element protein n=1 Tax=Caballeronia sordidicola TaxID=196367 RepID=A0A226WXA1_CABSO|nr:Mobile element protein [Caballeronia sordidicola]